MKITVRRFFKFINLVYRDIYYEWDTARWPITFIIFVVGLLIAVLCVIGAPSKDGSVQLHPHIRTIANVACWTMCLSISLAIWRLLTHIWNWISDRWDRACELIEKPKNIWNRDSN